MPNSISTHISAALGVVVAGIAALHPGFHLSSTTTGIIVAVGTIGAILLEGQHNKLKADVVRFAHEADMVLGRIGVTPSELGAAATVVESKLKPADQTLVTDAIGGAEALVAPTEAVVPPA